MNQCCLPMIYTLEGIDALEYTVDYQHRVKLAMNGMLTPVDIRLPRKVVHEAVDSCF